ncbi:MAG: hypothetical protein ACOC0H_06370 [Thermodesulfobacteriota bacterium]
MNHAKDLSLIIQSRIPLVVSESHEEDRVLEMPLLLPMWAG